MNEHGFYRLLQLGAQGAENRGMGAPRERTWTVLFVALALLTLLALIGVVLASRNESRSLGNAALAPPGPDPAEMLRVDEGQSLVVPLGKMLVVNGIITREAWSDATPVVIRFDGATVFQRSMFAGDVVTLPPGLAAGAGTVVEIDRLSPAADSRVTLLAQLAALRQAK